VATSACSTKLLGVPASSTSDGEFRAPQRIFPTDTNQSKTAMPTLSRQMENRLGKQRRKCDNKFHQLAGHGRSPYFLVEIVKNLFALRSVFKYQIG